MSAIRRVTSTADAEALAGLLNGPDRTRPTVVVTVASGQHEPYADVDEIAGQIGDLADVYVVTTGGHTWALSNRMKPGTQVYGGAGRVYPVGHEWLDDLRAAPLRFAWSRSEGKKLTGQLIDDALDMAAAAGLFDSRRTASTRERRTGVVRSIMSERALVELDGDSTAGIADMAVIPPQLAAAGVPIDRVLRPGMKVAGVLEKKSRWLDIREQRLPAEEALRPYAVGDVVPARVRTVSAGSAALWLHPEVTVEVSRSAVTDDPSDDLQVLLTPGEVVTARVVARGPGWQLSLRTVGEEAPRPAVPLYAGGPAWLDPFAAPWEPPQPPAPPPAAPSTAPDEHHPPPQPPPVDHVRPELPVPTPAMMPRRKGEPVRAATPAPPATPKSTGAMPTPAVMPHAKPPGTQPAQPDQPVQPDQPSKPAKTNRHAVESMSLQLAAERAEKSRMEHRLEELEEEVSALRNERIQLAKDFDRANRQLATRESELARMRSQLRKAKQRTAAPEMPEFADRERGFRHLVEAAWGRRIPVGEQAERPLVTYALGPEFLDSVDDLEGITVEKIADVVMEVLTGIADQSAGREMHVLRTSVGGNAAPQTRDDGATCYRVSLQINTPSARRLHFWKRADGTVELSRVVVHDDMEP